jgi:hypothetical protein
LAGADALKGGIHADAVGQLEHASDCLAAPLGQDVGGAELARDFACLDRRQGIIPKSGCDRAPFTRGEPGGDCYSSPENRSHAD